MITLRALLRLSFLEFSRDRIVWIGCFVALLLFGFTLILGALSFHEQQRILSHLGWATIEIATLGTSLILAASWLHKELDRQTCLLVLARPVSRGQFLVGKFLPILVLTFVLQFILAMCLWALLGFTYSGKYFLQVFFGTFLQVGMVFSVCFLSATVLRPTLAFFVGIGVYLIGNWVQEIEFFGKKYNIEFYENMAHFSKWAFPNLFQYNWRSVHFLENGVPTEQILWGTLHAFGWILFSVSVAILIFRRRDLV